MIHRLPARDLRPGGKPVALAAPDFAVAGLTYLALGLAVVWLGILGASF